MEKDMIYRQRVRELATCIGELPPGPHQAAPPPKRPAFNENDLYSYLWATSFAQYAKNETNWRILYMCRFYNLGLVEARLGNLKMAGFYFTHADSYIPTLSLRQEAECRFLKTMRLPALAYLYHKQGKPEKAKLYLKNAIQNDQLLENTGFPFFLFHRIQQYQNECRIQVSQRELPVALQRIATMIDFFIMGESDCPLLKDVKLDLNDEHICGLRSGMLLQLVEETFLTVVQQLRTGFVPEMERLFQASFKNYHRFTSRTEDDGLLADWCRLFNGLYLGDDGSLIERSICFLQTKGKKADKLKYFYLLHLYHESLAQSLSAEITSSLYSRLQDLSVPPNFHKTVKSLYSFN
jgi:Tetratricopeptide repeat